MYDPEREELERIRRAEAKRRAQEQREGPFPGESLDLPEENPKQYLNYNNNYGYGRGVRNYNNNYGGDQPQWEDPWEDDPDPDGEDWGETREDGWDEPEEADYRGAPQDKPQGPAIRAYNADFRSDAKEERRSARAGRKPAASRPRREEQEEMEEIQRYAAAQQEVPARKKRKKHRFFRKLLAVLLVLVLAAVGLCALLRKMPEAVDGLGARKDDCAAILIAGLDYEAVRTDTMMLLFLDGKNGRVNLLSLPRDTYVQGGYAVPKLNSVYGANGGGEEGMDALMDAVKDCIGYRPDGYLLVKLDAFVDIVDAMGGVKFDVPQDMYYDDPSQNLHIDLAAGLQTLNGEDAMGLVRYRSGYAMADLRRVEVQREFVAAAMDQWLSVAKIWRYPAALKALLSNTRGDLSLGNLIWIADTVRKADLGELSTQTLPGEPANLSGGSYYLQWPNATVELINESFNPYVRDITADDLNVAG